MSKKWSLVTLALAIFLIFISIRSASPPAVKMGEIPDTSFSVKRAYTHLLEVSHLPHFTGTGENARVREYIATACRQFGLTVEIQHTTSVYSRNGSVNAANIFNIIAVKKGSRNTRAVMLMSHYDSQLNTPGAGDDGASVAAMLETARALQKSGPLQNDLILLFTDGEEIGLMGAHAFLEECLLVKETGVVINFEGRGNSGPSNMFEVNDKNGWAIREFARSAAHPFANSLGYEIYKKLPNYTDLTLFKNAGITCLNNAYIDGFVNYHSPTDKPENMDLRSFQHHGDNMLNLGKHFGNLDIIETKAPDRSYFNVTGWFLHYPAAWNLIFVLVTDLLFILFLLTGIRHKKIKPIGFIIGTILFPVVLAVIYFTAKWLLQFIIDRYPLYSHFDQNNSYNGAWYFLAMSACAVTIFSFIYYLAIKKINSNSLLAGILFLMALLMNGMQYAIPSASYLLFIPLLFILATHLFVQYKNIREEIQPVHANIFNLIMVLPVVYFVSPVIYFTFIAFALGDLMPFVVIGAGICTGLMFPVVSPVLKNQQWLFPLIAVGCFLAAMTAGHFHSGYSKQLPLPSSLRYMLDADSLKAEWVSEFAAADKFTAGFFRKVQAGSSANGRNGMLTNDAPVIPLSPPAAEISKDTINGGNRNLRVHFSASREKVININIAIVNNSRVRSVLVNGKEAKPISGPVDTVCRNIRFTGVAGQGFDVLFEMDGKAPLEIEVSDRTVGLPVIPGFNTNYPVDIIPAQGGISNTIQVKKRYIF